LGNYDSKEPCGDCPAQTNPVIATVDINPAAEASNLGAAFLKPIPTKEWHQIGKLF